MRARLLRWTFGRCRDTRGCSRGGWLETPDCSDCGVAVRHGLVWRVHTSFKTGSTRYRLTTFTISHSFPSSLPSFLPPFHPPTLFLILSASSSKCNSGDHVTLPRYLRGAAWLSSHGVPSRNDDVDNIRKIVSKSSFPSSFRGLPVRLRVPRVERVRAQWKNARRLPNSRDRSKRNMWPVGWRPSAEECVGTCAFAEKWRSSSAGHRWGRCCWRRCCRFL